MMLGNKLLESLSAFGSVPGVDENWLGDATKPQMSDDTKLNMQEFMDSMNDEPYVDTTKTSLYTLPILGRIHFVPEWQGCLCVSITALYWIYGMWCTYTIILGPHYVDMQIKGGLLIIYGIVGALCISALYRAATSNPGRVYKYMSDHANSEDSEWTWCNVCRFRRPPRAHHCRRCQHCVLRMDHHCPWINNCVGEENHYLFLQLVFYAFTLSVFTLCIDIVHIYRLPACTSCDKDSFALTHEKFFMGLSMFLSVVMSCGAVGLVVMHHIGFLMDMTTIDWMRIQRQIKETGMGSHIQIPSVQKSCFRGYADMCGTRLCFLWPFPCIKKRPSVYSYKSYVA